MCGIAGIIRLNKKAVDADEIRSMLKIIKHRGPDDEGLFVKENVGLGHVRLSIIDLSSAGHQPMFSNENRYAIIFNGEIYNYLELKEELKDSYSFKTKTDTEVILAAYSKWGEACLSKFNGDFSFAIYDLEQNTLFAARDRFGIKPFYFYHNNDQFVFASEIKALLPMVKDISPNNKIIFEYLLYNRTDQSTETFFKDIFKLKHGHCVTIKNNEVKIKQWYDLASQLKYPSTFTPKEFREELKKSIKLRLRSDVPVGVCLSGGLDSSTLTAIVFNDFGVKELKTFSAVYEKGTWADESPFVDAFKDRLTNMHSTTPTAETFFDEFTDFIVSLGEPIPGVSPYAQYKVMQLAKNNVEVTLDGQGADEMLGGYNYLYGSYFKELFTSFKWMTLIKEAVGYYKNNPSKEAFKYFIYYMLPISLKKYTGRKTFGSVSEKFYNEYYKSSTIAADFYNPTTLHNFFLLHFEHKLEHLLKWDDHNSMRFSIESRVPFLDHHLVEKALSLPASSVLRDGISKYILRESVKDILPSKIYNRRDKKGFETPSDLWFKTPQFQKYITELLNSESFIKRGYFNVEDCKQKNQKHLNGEGNYSKDIWKWINLEVWFQQFIDKK
ncbi:MAG: asparagine synthase (glutamine-hydrolyzing) [Bacteroidia bacterium]